MSLRYEVLEKRVAVIEAGMIIRGAWQRPRPLARLVDRESIRTIVTLTAINTNDPKYVDQKRVIDQTGVDWVIVPMRGSTATLEQLAEAADLLASPARQPIFYHCVAGHHRTNLVTAAYRIRCQGWSVDRAWNELCSFSWTEPEADRDDRRLLVAFAQSRFGRPERETNANPDAPSAAADRGVADRGRHRADGLAMGDGELRRR